LAVSLNLVDALGTEAEYKYSSLLHVFASSMQGIPTKYQRKKHQNSSGGSYGDVVDTLVYGKDVSLPMAEPIRASTVILIIGVGLLIAGVFVHGRPDFWVSADLGAGIMIVFSGVMLILGVILRWGGGYFSS
jgi:hypothetical protein